MAKLKNRSGFLKYLIPTILILVLSVFFVVNKQRFSQQDTQTPAPTIFPDQAPVVPANWKTFTDTKNKVSFKYPYDWFVVFSTWGGRDNYLVLHNTKDKNQCIGFEGAPSNQGDLDTQIRLVADGYGSNITQKNITAKQSTIVNGQEALIEQLNYPGILQFEIAEGSPQYQSQFFAGGINGGDAGYMVVDTCSLAEKEVYNIVFHSVKFE